MEQLRKSSLIINQLKFQAKFIFKTEKYEMQSSVLSEQESKESQKHNAIEKEIIGCISKIARPFTANQLLSELKEYSKNDLELGLDRLVKKNEVLLKTQNKIKIYYYNFKSEVYQEKV